MCANFKVVEHVHVWTADSFMNILIWLESHLYPAVVQIITKAGKLSFCRISSYVNVSGRGRRESHDLFINMGSEDVFSRTWITGWLHCCRNMQCSQPVLANAMQQRKTTLKRGYKGDALRSFHRKWQKIIICEEATASRMEAALLRCPLLALRVHCRSGSPYWTAMAWLSLSLALQSYSGRGTTPTSPRR